MNIPLGTFDYTDEFELAEACRKGIPKAQSALYRQYASRLLLLCFRYTGAGEDAKEILADVFVEAFRNWAQFNYLGKGSLQAWLSRIAVNRCLMYLRKKSLRFENLNEGHEQVSAYTETALDQLSAKEIMQLVHQLPTGYRTVFNLFVFEEMPHKEIAALLGITESTSKTQLHKARQLLQSQLQHLKRNVL